MTLYVLWRTVILWQASTPHKDLRTGSDCSSEPETSHLNISNGCSCSSHTSFQPLLPPLHQFAQIGWDKLAAMVHNLGSSHEDEWDSSSPHPWCSDPC